MSENAQSIKHERPPVVAIMGHVDHGKSTLLDYIQKTNIVAGEAGGITQHLSAYEATHTTEDGESKTITFIDTPGHAAFSHMRHRGARIADIAILIISAVDSVKTQTIEAIETILKHEIPYVVAINMIDKPEANPDRVKTDLLEHGVYLEGFGGDVPYAEISAKHGQNVEELLNLLLLVAELQEFTADPTKPASGFVIESHLDEKRGISATLIIKNGTLNKGQFVVADDALCSTRIYENFAGKSLETAQFSTPVTLIGFSQQPNTGTMFQTFATKKEAEKAVEEAKLLGATTAVSHEMQDSKGRFVIPMVVKADTQGTQEAVIAEIEKLSDEKVYLKIVKTGIGAINESDLKILGPDTNALAVGFNVTVDKTALDCNECEFVTMEVFSIIYKMTEWLEELKEKRRPKQEVEKITGAITILKVFNKSKGKQVVGGRVKEGVIISGSQCRLVRNGEILGRGKLSGLQQARVEVQKIEDVGSEFGMMVTMDTDIAERDELQIVEKVIE